MRHLPPALLVLLPLSLGCVKDAPEPVNPHQAALAGAPDWVLGDCAAAFEAQPPPLCQVGVMQSTKNLSLARSTATDRARDALAREIRSEVKGFVRDYQLTLTGGGAYGEASGDEQVVEKVSIQTTSLTLSGSRLVESWIGPDGSYFALVALEPQRILNALEQMDDIDPVLQREIYQRAEQAWGRVDEYVSPKETP